MSQDKEKKRLISTEEAIETLQPDSVEDAGDIVIIPGIVLVGISPAQLTRKKAKDKPLKEKAMSHHPDDIGREGRSCPKCPDGCLKQLGDLVIGCDHCNYNEIGCLHGVTSHRDGKKICELCGEVLQTA